MTHRQLNPTIKQITQYYLKGLSDIEIASKLNISERSVQVYLSRLRHLGKLPYRSQLGKTTKNTKISRNALFPEVNQYLKSATRVFEETYDLYQHIPFKRNYKKNKQSEDLVLLWSDMHTDMINSSPLTGTVTYNPDIQKQELRSFQRGFFRFVELYKPSYKIETLYIFSLGDMVTNDRIYEGQLYNIVSGIGEQIIKATNYICDFIRWSLHYFPRIVIVFVYGNHGRTYSEKVDEPATNNFEYLLANMVCDRFRDNQRVRVIIPNDYVHSIEIRNHKYLLTHGDSIRGSTLNSIERAAKEISLLLGKNFHEVIAIGHFHSIQKMQITPDSTLLVNGCFVHHDRYAYLRLRKHSTAKQLLFSVSKKSALHNLQEINLRWEYDDSTH